MSRRGAGAERGKDCEGAGESVLFAKQSHRRPARRIQLEQTHSRNDGSHGEPSARGRERAFLAASARTSIHHQSASPDSGLVLGNM